MKKRPVLISFIALSLFVVPLRLQAQSNIAYSIEATTVTYNIRNYGFSVEPWINIGQFSFGIGAKYNVAPSKRMVYTNPQGSFAIAKAHNLAFSIDAQYQIPSKSSWNESFRLGFTFANTMLNHSEITNGVATENCGTKSDNIYLTLGAKTAKCFGENISISLMPYFSYYFTHSMEFTRVDLGLQLGFGYRF